MDQTTPEMLDESTIELFRQRGFVRIPDVVTKEEAKKFRIAALDASKQSDQDRIRPVFSQHVNVWRQHKDMSELTLHPNVGAIAQKLAGAPMRLWHDHILIKEPHNEVATEFHQD